MGKKRVALIYTFLGYVVILAVLVAVALVIGGGHICLSVMASSPRKSHCVSGPDSLGVRLSLSVLLLDSLGVIGATRYFG
jgi:hypothetical protein